MSCKNCEAPTLNQTQLQLTGLWLNDWRLHPLCVLKKFPLCNIKVETMKNKLIGTEKETQKGNQVEYNVHTLLLQLRWYYMSRPKTSKERCVQLMAQIPENYAELIIPFGFLFLTSFFNLLCHFLPLFSSSSSFFLKSQVVTWCQWSLMTCQLLLCLTRSKISLKHHVQTQRWILLLFLVEFKAFTTDTQYFLALQKGRNRKCTKVSGFLKRWCEIEKELYILKRHP